MNEVVHTSPTIGSNVEEVECLHAVTQHTVNQLFHQFQFRWKKQRFLMWDIGGQESLRASWHTYYQNTDVGLSIWSFLCGLKWNICV
jgi:GTPase SAR1 family protein